jgi:hypothetical protein
MGEIRGWQTNEPARPETPAHERAGVDVDAVHVDDP